jgi:hypothetical protein
LHYSQTRDALLRSFDWNFASARAELTLLQTLTLDSSPKHDVWAVGDVITGTSSYTTATVVSVTSNIEYEIAYISGDFTDGETITNAIDIAVLTWEGIPLEYEDETLLWYDESASDDVKCGTGYPTVADLPPDFEWSYKFKLPDDFLRLKSDYTADETLGVNDRFTIEGKYLLTNDDEAEVRYIRKVTDPAEFDPLFTEVLILQLALKLVNPLAGTNTSQLKRDLKQDLADAMRRARTVCSTEINVSGRSDWNLARYGSGKV